jgi:hypothetical protein
MERDGGGVSKDNLTRARRALRDAARRLTEEADTAPVAPLDRPDDDGVAELAPQTTAAEEPASEAASCRLLEVDELFVGRPVLGADFAYRDASGEVLADVEVLHTPEHAKLDALLAGESTRHVDERWVVVHDGEPLFFVEQYRATGGSSYGVFSPDGDSLGTYVSEGGVLHHNVVVREASSAPVATIRVRHHRHVITHANGAEIGYCWRAFVAIGNDEDDEAWGLRLEGDADLLDRRALVAAPLVCHLMAFPKRHFDSGGEIGILLVETVPPVGLAVVVIERTLDGLYWLRRRLD